MSDSAPRRETVTSERPGSAAADSPADKVVEHSTSASDFESELQTERAERLAVERTLGKRLELEQLLATISTRFINVEIDHVDGAIEAALRHIAEFIGADLACLLRMDAEEGAECSHSFAAETVSDRGTPSPDRLPWVVECLRRFESVHIPRVADLPVGANDDREFLESQGVKSMLAIPMSSAGTLYGIVCFESLAAEREWTQADVGLLRIVGETFVSALERKRAETRLRESEHRLRAVTSNTPVVLFATDRRGIVTFSDGRGLEGLGLKPGEVVGQSVFEIYSEVPDIAKNIRRALRGHTFRELVEVEGLWFETSHAPIFEGDDVVGMIGVATDVTDRVEAESARRHSDDTILYEALHDPLTELPNRNYFVNRLASAIERVGDDQIFAVLFLDLDRFKLVNYGLGHVIGDRLLVEVAQRLTRCLRPGDTVARMGGDEFTVLLENLPRDSDIPSICQRFQDALRDVHQLDGQEIFTSASIGVAVGDSSYENAEEVLRDADTAMYHAKKEGGRGQQVVYDRRMQEQAMAQLRLENDLRRAVERNEFKIQYQPIVALDNGRISGFEALVRWEHPQHGLVSPEDFIGVAEDTGLIHQIGRWMLRTACHQTRLWHDAYPHLSSLGISVNVSSREFARPDLLDVITEVLGQTGLEPSALRLEITETLIMENADSVLAMLIKLKELGVQLSIDDFGTGYSSLSRLHRFPIDAFKIDRSFVSRIGVADENPEIVRTIVTLARNLGMDVIAEGVETSVQVEHLRNLGCGWGQGFIFSRPQDADIAGELVRDDRRYLLG